MFVTELFEQSKGYKLYDEIINAVAPTILTKCFQEKKFIKVEAQKAVQAMINNCVHDSTLLSLCKGCFHKNFNICELSAKALLEMIQKFGENISKLQNSTFRDLFLTLAKVSTFTILYLECSRMYVTVRFHSILLIFSTIYSKNTLFNQF